MFTKKIASVALLLGLMLSWSARPASAASILSVEPPSQAVQSGQSVSFDVRISNVTDLYAFQFDLMFDPLILSASSITEGLFLPSGGVTVFIPGFIDNSAGTITFTGDSLVGSIPGVSGNGTIATVEFQALTSGISAITLSNALLLDSGLAEIPVSIATIPEPATWLLLATGCLCLLVYGWRQRRHNGWRRRSLAY